MSSAIAIQPGVIPDLDSFLQPQAWVEMNPTLNVANAAGTKNPGVLKIDDDTAKYLEGLLIREGYFHVPQIPWNLPLADMAQAVVRLVERGLVPPFCFMYDEFWLMFVKL